MDCAYHIFQEDLYLVSVVKADSNTRAAQTTEAVSASSTTDNSTTKVAKAPKIDDNCIIRFIGYFLAA
ncbi:MAG: hypothetical protein K5644_07140 [Lachnospiraceae bacterium]|nr:hypothetical protein [Lachnospiraceae bacterium]